MMKKESKFCVEMKGLGVSLIDNEPKEVMFLSVYKLSFHIEKVSLHVSNPPSIVDRAAIQAGRAGRRGGGKDQ
jgi:hypothetical protein